jgi:hypothetical protein
MVGKALKCWHPFLGKNGSKMPEKHQKDQKKPFLPVFYT